MRHPERIARLAILNSVHVVGFERQIRKWSQIKKSWYVFFFLLPWLPEWWLSRKALATPPPDWVPNARVEHIPNGSHWVHHDEPKAVTALLLEHFRQP
jgi:hypothetical protein